MANGDWGKTDSANSVPLWVTELVAKPQTVANRNALYNNTALGAFIPNKTVGIFLTPYGWVLRTTNSGGRGTRIQEEILCSYTKSSFSNVVQPPVYVTLESQTTALTAAQTAAGTAPSSGQQAAYDRFFKRLKTLGILSAIDITKHRMWIVDQTTSGSKIINVFNPGVGDMTMVGAPTYTPNVGFTNAASGNYYDSGIPLSAIDQNNHMLVDYSKTVGTGSNYDIGAANGSTAGTAQGFGLMSRDSNGQYRFRSSGVEVIAGTSASGPGKGFSAMVRRDANNVEIWRDDQLLTTVASASAPITTGTLTNTLQWGRTSGVLGVSQRTHGLAALLPTLTAIQIAGLANAVRALMEYIEFGAINLYEKLVSGNETLTFDDVIYGGNADACARALQAKRSGLNVCMVLGSDEHVVGGVMTGGLGASDITVPSGGDTSFKNMLNGIPRDWISRTAAYYNNEYSTSRTDVIAMFEPRLFQRVLNNDIAAAGIPVYKSAGIASVNTSGLTINSFTTNCGRTFVATNQFSDRSVTGDLMAKSQIVTYTVGRDAATPGATVEQYAGYRGFTLAQGANSSQYTVNIDPYVTMGVSSSGKIATVFDTPSYAIGTGDGLVQDTNYRIIVTNIANRRIPFFTAGSPPAGYNRAYYEALDRTFVASPSLGLGDVFIALPNLLAGSAAAGVFDWNNGNNVGFSTDMPGSGTRYAAATNETDRQTVAIDVLNKHVLGLIYYLGYETNSNVPSALRTSLLAYGWDAWHFPAPRSDGPSFHLPQSLYVREFRHMSGMMKWTGDDAMLADTDTPRSGRTAAHAFYAVDRHSDQTLINSSGYLQREGVVNFHGTGGADGVAPIFVEAFLPKPTECINLDVGNCASFSGMGHGAYRMEFGMAMGGQHLGAMSAIKKRKNLTRIQDVAYSDTITELASAPDTTKVAYVQNNATLGAPAS